MRALLEIALGNALVAAGLAVVAATAGRLARRPALTHSLWLVVLLKLVTPPLIAVPLAIDLGRSATAESTFEAPATGPAAAGPEAVELWVVPVAEPVAMIEAEAPPVATPWRPDSRWLAWAVVGVWLAGSIAWAAVVGWRLWRFGRALRAAEPATTGVRRQVEAAAARLGLSRAPGTWLVPCAVSPMVWAPAGSAARLVLPAALWGRLDDEQRATLLLHELAHLRRRDHWVRWLELTATGLFWWHPVVWWARRELREAEEQCCDAWVVWARPDAAGSYARALLAAVEFLSQARPALPVAASGIGRVEHLKRRLTMIMRGVTPRGLSWAGRLGVIGVGGLLLPVLPIAGAGSPDDEPKRVEVRVEKTEDQPIAVEVIRAGDEPVAIVDFDNIVRVIRDDEEGDDEDEAGDKPAEKSVRRRVRIDRRDGDGPKDKVKEGDGPKANPEEIEAARRELREAEVALHKALQRLDELEGGSAKRKFQLRTEGDKVIMLRGDGEGHPKIVGPMGPIRGEMRIVGPEGGPGVRHEVRVFGGPRPPAPPAPPGDGPPPPPPPPDAPDAPARGEIRVRTLRGDPEPRVAELERQLNELRRELESMRRDRGPRERSDRPQ